MYIICRLYMYIHIRVFFKSWRSPNSQLDTKAPRLRQVLLFSVDPLPAEFSVCYLLQANISGYRRYKEFNGYII